MRYLLRASALLLWISALSAVAPARSQTALPLSVADLIRDHLYISPSGNHFLIFRPDGDLIVVDTDGQILWGLGGIGVPFQGADRVAMQPDGNLVVYAADGAYIWSALTADPDPSARLTISADGDLQIVTDDGPVWSARRGVLRPAAGAPTEAMTHGGEGPDACAPAGDAAGGMLAPGRTPSFISDVACLERLAHEAANRVRQQAGRKPLRWSDRYAAVARAHSEDMVRRGYFAHDTPEGATVSDRMVSAGVDCASYPAENIAAAFATGVEMLNSADEVVSVEWLGRDALGAVPVAQWMDSPPHRRNLLNPAHTQHAVGFAWDAANQQFLVTQLFCE